jgi:sulfhydrogenase subunit gamma (sulfur reductase)
MTPYAFHPARIVAHRVEAERIHTFTMRFTDPRLRRTYRFAAGQFNMLYAFGTGEVPISIVSDPDEPGTLEHTISAVGRVTKVMARWKVGDVAGVRGPYGRGWPMDSARGREVIIVTGGLGCAPVVGVIDYIFRRRDDYGTVHILHGVKTPHDLLYRERFEAWRQHPRTKVYLTAEPSAIVMMCGPEAMMRYAARALREKGISEENVYLSMERHMQCAIGMCGHCQFGPHFVCKDGPIFQYAAVKRLLGFQNL